MKWLDRLLERRSTNNAPGGDSYWQDFASLRSSTAVTAENAQGVSACYAAVGVIAEAIGSLPLHLYKRNGDDRIKAIDHPLNTVLHHAPNDQQSSVEFFEWMTACMLLRGNSFARVERGYDGQVRSLLPMQPDRVEVFRKGDRISGYGYTDRDGKRETLLPEEVFHLRHRAGTDPLLGVSPITAARGVIELAMAEAEHGNATFRNGTRATGILSIPQKLRPEQRQSLRESWQSQYAGGSNAGRTVLLEEGATFTPVSMSLEDSDWVSARRFSVEEVARLYKVPPPLIGDMSHSTYSNSVEMARWFVVHTLGRHMAAWEGAISRQLLTEAGRRIYYPEFSAEGMLRGDAANRAAFYSSGISAGWMLRSEARKLENLPSIEGVDDQAEGQTSNPTPAPQPYPSKQREAQA